MQSNRCFLNFFFKWFMWTATVFLLITNCEAGKISEGESLFNFIRAVDPKNMLKIAWNESLRHPCLHQWKGIKCSLHSSYITEIWLESLELSGKLDWGSLCRIPLLQVVSLADNQIQGRISESISNCKSLTAINLSSNLLSGKLPLSLSKMKNLKNLDISNNPFMRSPTSLPKYSTESNALAENTTESPSISLEISKSNDGTKHMDVDFMPLILGIGFFILFGIFASRRAAKLANEKEILKFLADSPITSPAAKTTQDLEKAEEKKSELVFFVEEKQRFELEDLFEGAADIQSQNMCSSLYKVTLKNNAIFVVKRLKKLKVSFEEFGRTMKIIGELKHPNILPLVGYHSSDEQRLLIYNYQRNGSLLALLQKYIEGKSEFPWRFRLSIACGIARGLNFIHQKLDGGKIIPHGNIKLSNILLNETGEPLISEYGYSRFIDPNTACAFPSNGYKAPEKRLTEEGDVYSFGVILLELLTGKTIEKSGLDLPKWVRAMVREEWTGEVFDKEVIKGGKQLVFPLLNTSLQCVSVSPEVRPTMAELLERIEDMMDQHEDHSFSSVSSVESYHPDSSLLHTVIPENWDTPGSTQ